MQSVKARDPLIYREFLELTNPALYVNMMMNQGLLLRLDYFLVICTFLPASQNNGLSRVTHIKGGDMVQVSLPLLWNLTMILDITRPLLWAYQEPLIILFIFICW